MYSAKQQPTYRSSYLTLDPTINQNNSSYLYFRNWNGPQDTSGNIFFSLQAAINNDPTIRINRYDASGNIDASGYLYDTVINNPYNPNPYYSTVTITGLDSTTQNLLTISTTSCINYIYKDGTNGSLTYNFSDTRNIGQGVVTNYYKSHSGTTSTEDEYASFAFYGTTGNLSNGLGAYLTIKQDGPATLTTVPGSFRFFTTNRAGSIAERMRIDSSGNVGIGTIPTTTLDVNGNGKITTSNQNTLLVKGNALDSSINKFGGSTNNGQVIISGTTNTTNRLGLGVDTVNQIGVIQAVTISDSGLPLALNTGSGNVGVNTITPNESLDVSGSAVFGISGEGVLRLSYNSGNTYIQSGNSKVTGSSGNLYFTDYQASRRWMTLDLSGNLGIGLAPSRQLDISGSASLRNNVDNNFSSSLAFYKSKNNGTTLVNSELGYISFYGTDASSVQVASQRSAYIIGSQDMDASYNFVPGRIGFFTTNSSGLEQERVRIDSSGNVGIGTTSISAVLDVSNSAIIGANNNGVIRLRGEGNINYIESGLSKTSGSAGPLRFTDYGASNTWMTITSTGSVGIGTTTPNATFEVVGSMRGRSVITNINVNPSSISDWTSYFNTTVFLLSGVTSFNISFIPTTPSNGTIMTFKNISGIAITISGLTALPALVTLSNGDSTRLVYTDDAIIGAGWYVIA